MSSQGLWALPVSDGKAFCFLGRENSQELTDGNLSVEPGSAIMIARSDPVERAENYSR
jgi:hypothetical protein